MSRGTYQPGTVRSAMVPSGPVTCSSTTAAPGLETAGGQVS